VVVAGTGAGAVAGDEGRGGRDREKVKYRTGGIIKTKRNKRRYGRRGRLAVK
jgi:hypothetical protein